MLKLPFAPPAHNARAVDRLSSAPVRPALGRRGAGEVATHSDGAESLET